MIQKFSTHNKISLELFTKAQWFYFPFWKLKHT